MDKLSDYPYSPVEDQAMQPVTESSNSATPFPRRYPAIVHAAVVATVIFPITLLPYLAARRRIGRLRRNVTTLESQIAHLRWNSQTMRAETQRIKIHSRHTLDSHLALAKEFMKQDAKRNAVEASMQADICELLHRTQHLRSQTATLKEVGTSLTDVAAFMREVEGDFGMKTSPGNDLRGIERLRLLASHMQSLQTQVESPK